MRLPEPFDALSPADLAALAFLVIAWWAIGHFTEHPPRGRPSTSVLMKDYRRDWMRQFVTRQPRIFDASIMDSLRQGTSFYASACMIAIGGGVAFLGDPQKLSGLNGDLPLLQGGPALWQLKFMAVLLLLTNAMLKFIWSHRLFGYCSVLMAAVPNDHDAPDCLPRALQAADINIHAAKNFNHGLRAVYFALAALAWLLGPVALSLATLATLYVTWRREFGSHSRRILLSRPGAQP
ncbi:MAG: DUF599 domain-containing protein [Proteobacteria bacterium]|nr:DUF599 domain-containing protein [Pseudomonadota bacterium]MBS0574568.1 DUF599 domain-containing protein [Pseudomonadota bacterium]